MSRFSEKIFSALSSTKLTIAVLFTLGFAAIPGTLVDPQKSTYDFYHSWWFTLILFTLSINLLACTFYRRRTHISPILIHLSLLLILAGGIVGSRLGFRGTIFLADGEATNHVQLEKTLRKADLPFQVRSDGFRIHFYGGTKRPSDYESDLVIIKDGKEVTRKTVRVNDPLRYEGITFYQASYDERPKAFAVQIRDQKTGKIIDEQKGGFSDPLKIAKAKAVLTVVDYTPDFQGFGPAALALWEKSGEAPQKMILFKNYPLFEARNRGNHLPIFAEIENSYSTGLQAVKDPGVPLVWTGCGLLLAGLAMGLAVPKPRKVKVTAKKMEVSLATVGTES